MKTNLHFQEKVMHYRQNFLTAFIATDLLLMSLVAAAAGPIVAQREYPESPAVGPRPFSACSDDGGGSSGGGSSSSGSDQGSNDGETGDGQQSPGPDPDTNTGSNDGPTLISAPKLPEGGAWHRALPGGRAGPLGTFLVDCHDRTGSPVRPDKTTEIVTAIENAARFCAWLPASVRTSCVADRLREIARGLPRTGGYAAARDALGAAAGDLSALARNNARPGTPERRYAATPPDGSPVQSTRRGLTEVAPDRVAGVNAAAARVIERTQTTLLRSSENSRTRMVAYQEIAAALDSTKVLLRSV